MAALPALGPDELLILDFDRTLFDTVSFLDALAKEMERTYGIAIDRWNADHRNFLGDVATDQCYNIPAHIESYGLGWQQVREHLAATFPANGFLFPDSSRLIQRVRDLDRLKSTSILTYGEKYTQLFKIALAPMLTGLPVAVTGSPEKGAFLAKAHPGGSGILIDDKYIDPMPVNFAFIQIVRPGAKYQGQAKHIISSFDEFVF